MMLGIIFILICCIFSDNAGTAASSLPGITHFEKLDSDLLHPLIRSASRLSKREAPIYHLGFDVAEKIPLVLFNITAFNRIFRIKIQSSGNAVNQRILAPGFQVFRVSATGEKQEVKLSFNQFFTGVLEDDDGSEVFGYVDHNGNAMLTIKTATETYSVEPFNRFVPENNASVDIDEEEELPQDYIIYRASDLRMPNNSSFCGAKDFHEDEDNYARYKRQANNEPSTSPSPDISAVRQYSTSLDSDAKDSCELCLTADYTFFSGVGRNDETATTNYMIYLVSQVNNIYRKELFGRDMLNFGFTVKRVEVHAEPTPSTENPSKKHYNAKQDTWDQGVLLESFSRTGSHSGCCLSHLFTHRPFDGGVLGLAYLANSDMFKVGGICSSAGSFFVNTGWSSTMFADGSLVPSQQAVLVLAHELGHNWGSPHDLDDDTCAPSSNFGGKYIMWMYSVPGYEKNNWHFSSCSLSAIGQVLRAKSGNCFRPRPRAVCGNGFIEEKEECDAGPIGLRGEDKCCNPDCTLRPPALCSDANQVCCRGCRPASNETLCWRENDLAQSSTCLGRAFCNGTTAECQPRELLSGKPCFDHGQCSNGTCLPFCEVHGYKTCMCDMLESACKYCCFIGNFCKPLELDDGPRILANGRPCPYGVCSQGVCKKTMMNTVEKFWSYLNQIDVNNLAKFMRDNIVGVTIVIALIVWIPLSCTIWCLDRRQEKMLEESYKRRECFGDQLVERKSKIYYLSRPGQAAGSGQSFGVVYPAQPQPNFQHYQPAPLQSQYQSLSVGQPSADYKREYSFSPSRLTATGVGSQSRIAPAPSGLAVRSRNYMAA